MRKSTYEIILPLIGSDEKEIEGKKLLINGLYGAIDVVDDEIADKITRNEINGLSLEMRERLALRGHITRKDEEEELKDALLFGRIFSQTDARISVGPVILPTYNCNFRCPYCFEKHRLSRGQEWLTNRMKPEMVEAIFSALKKLEAKGRKIDDCSLYGGEPFLKENKDIVRNICEHAREMGLKLHAITNGYDLDHFRDILKEFDFDTIQITVDGVGEMNDRRRLHRDGTPTYEKILNNISLALEAGVGVRLRVNVNRENIGGIKPLIEDLKKRGLTDRFQKKEENGAGEFSYYFKAVSENKNSPTWVSEKMVMDEILAAGIPPMEAIPMQSQYHMHLGALTKAMKKDVFPGISTAFCGTEKGMTAVAPDGKIYPCWDIVAMENEAVGHTDIESGSFVYYFNKSKWRLRTSDRMKPCQTCPYIFICRGGCAAEACREHGSYFREFCGEIKETFAFVASRTAGRKWEETKESELTVSMYGIISRLSEEERKSLWEEKDPNDVFKLLKKYEFIWETE